MGLARFLYAPLFWARFCILLVLSLVALQLGAVDLNSATQAQLQQIKGIGPKTAERIIEERTRAGPFDSLSDLSDRVKGIGPKRLVSLEASGLKVESQLAVKAADKATDKTVKKEPKP